MPVNRVAEQVFGTMGTVCWTGQIVPQIWKSWREKATEGLSHWLMLIWGIASMFLGIFNISQNLNIPLIIQPQAFGFLSMVSWSQCLYYDNKRPLRQVVLVFAVTLVLLGGFEAGMVFAARPAINNGNERPATFFGVMASILLAIGLLPQYGEIIRFREVKGISMSFITIDTLGGVFSLLSLVFREQFDALASVAYSLVVVLDSVVIILAIMLNPRAERRRRRLAQENADRESHAGTVMDNVADIHQDQDSTPISPRISLSQQSTSRGTSLTRFVKPRDGEKTAESKDDSEKDVRQDS